jgi:acetyl esterase/lipase
MHGDKNQRKLYSNFATFWAQRGIGTVVTNYRLSPGVKHPEHIKDVAKAFAWTHKNIQKYGGRPDCIYLSGHSAGGHLVALLATDESYLKSEGLSLRDIRGVMPISGVYRIHKNQDQAGGNLDQNGKAGAANGDSSKLDPLATVFGKDPEGRKQASPLTHVRPGLPPFLIFYADKDLPMLPALAREFDLALKANKCTASAVEVKERNHMSIIVNSSADTDPVAQAMRAFMEEHDTSKARTAGSHTDKK